MDNEFEDIEHIRIPFEEWGVASGATVWSAKDALVICDASWYTRASQSARWMDIIGDYAGEELFLVNGDSLLNAVLDDPLLAIGKENGMGLLIVFGTVCGSDLDYRRFISVPSCALQS